MDSNKKKRLIMLVVVLIEVAIIIALACLYFMKKETAEINGNYRLPAAGQTSATTTDEGKTSTASGADNTDNGNGTAGTGNISQNVNTVINVSGTGIEPYTLGEVNQSYFDDALFVGDSRTVGLRAYGNLNNADFFCKTGISTNALFDYPALDEETGMTLTQTLTQGKTYKKIYIMLGVNDLGYGTLQSFLDEYTAALAKIRSYQPDAVIYIESIIGVTKNMEASDPGKFSQDRINQRNAVLEGLCDGRQMIYLDIAGTVADSEGYLTSGFSADGLHLGSDYYYLWTDYLFDHAADIH